MAWRLHLANQAVRAIAILPAETSLVAAWLRADRVALFDLNSGAPHDDLTLFVAPTSGRDSAAWGAFIAGLRAPNGAFFPSVQLDGLTAYLSDDGRLRLYDLGYGALALDNDGVEIALDTGDAHNFPALALDRLFGGSAVLDESGKLYIYRQHVRVGVFDIGLAPHPEMRLHVNMTRGGGMIYASDGACIVQIDSGGKIRKRLDTHYNIRQIACSPDGRYLATIDLDNGVLRVYNGENLTPTHQRFAIDLVADATQVQLLADLPPTFVAPSTLACDDTGRIAFSMAGVVCVSHLAHMDELPRPRPLL